MNFPPKSRFLHAILVKPVSNRRGDFTDVPDTLAKKILALLITIPSDKQRHVQALNGL